MILSSARFLRTPLETCDKSSVLCTERVTNKATESSGERPTGLSRKRTLRKSNVGHFSCLSHLSEILASAEVLSNGEIHNGSLNMLQY